MALGIGMVLPMSLGVGFGATEREAAYEKEILPILKTHCFDCHADGEKKGEVSFDTFASTEALLGEQKLWMHVLKNVRSGLMPPVKKERLSPAEFEKLQQWIKRDALLLDPANPDPGRVTLRRLNRIEYRNTIRDLMGIEFKTEEEFPADDTGYGFDTIGDVLTMSPLLMEKYMQAAETIVQSAVPLVSRIIPEQKVDAEDFRGEGSVKPRDDEQRLSLYEAADIAKEHYISKPGTYRVKLNAAVNGSFDFDPGKANAAFLINGKEVWKEELKWKDDRKIESTTEVKLDKGQLPLRLTLVPLLGKDQKPAERPGEGARNVELRFGGVTLEGPLEKEFAAHPRNYSRFFTREDVPADAAERKVYAGEILRRFTTRAFRRPVDDATVERLVGLAEMTANAKGGTFEQGIARAISAVLASPRFLFRMEDVLPESAPDKHPLLDEYALASRLSYFLWSTMPDEKLFDLAQRGELRAKLGEQVQRLLNDDRADSLVRNFAGQWLQTRDVESVSIDARIVQARDAGTEQDMRQRFEKRQRLNREIDEAEKAHDTAKAESLRAEMAELRKQFGTKRIEFSGGLRSAMRREAEMFFRHLMKTDSSVLQLLETDSTFLNGELADFYGIPGVSGGEMRLVKLPPDSVRGGVLTMGTVLAVTSNPTRTSPVKRGLFILENILGTPPPPPPANVPALEASDKPKDGREPSLREVLAKHREQPICSSCHNSMDPLGLALENFNAMGLFREKERGQPIPQEPGQLITGETFKDVRELKHILATTRRTDFYRCMTEKLLTYSLGRGPEACDILAIDGIVERLEKTQGKFSSLLMGVIESVPFQQRRRTP